MFGIIEHHLHRIRRGYLSPYFSTRACAGLEPIIHERIQRAFARIDQHMDHDAVLSFDGIWSALTADIISYHFYGKQPDYLGLSDFHFAIRDGFVGLTHAFNLTRFLPLVIAALKRLPQSWIKELTPSFGQLLVIRDEIERHCHGAFLASQKGSDDSELSSSVIVDALVSPHIPPQDRTVDRLIDEGTTILLAGTVTTARSLSVIMLYLLSQPECLEKLRTEIDDSLPPSQDFKYSLAILEKLPYLTAVIHEGLRLSFGPITPAFRVSPEHDLVYKNYNIPAGTPVGQSTYFISTDERIFQDPHKFDPERWIKAAEEGVNLKRNMVVFSQGSRMCLGFNLAFTEMYLTISRIVRQYDFELFGTTLADLDVTHVHIFGYPKAVPGKKDFLGEIRVKVRCKKMARC